MISVTQLRDNLARHEGASEQVARICRAYGLELRDVAATGKGRTMVARARRECWSLLHGTLGMSASELARMWGVDHSSILHGLRKREQELRRLYDAA